MKVPYDLTCWYLNSRRVIELTGSPLLYSKLDSIKGLEGVLRKNAEQQILKDALTGWLSQYSPQTLGKLALENRLKEGVFFTHYSNFFFGGLPKVSAALAAGKAAPMARAYSKLTDWHSDGRVEFEFSHEHLTSTSAWVELSGQKRLLVLGLVKGIEGSRISATPYVIANPAPSMFDECEGARYWASHLEVHIDGIETFKKVCDLPERQKKTGDLTALRSVPEIEIKKAFAEIIGEPTIPKDWGGEQSDLFSSRVCIDGKRISAAFVFKGPAQFRPMTLAQLGKNGDQINRLFTEPADLLVLQHCHEITTPVRRALRAFAQQMGNLRLYCVIDGYDTIRILEAYGKCGFIRSP